MFRGGLAWGVKKASCTENKKSCPGCREFDACAYSYLFESSLAEGIQIKEIPRPYLIHLTDEGKQIYSAGETLSFRIVLFGMATYLLPIVILGLQQFAELGLGAAKKPFAVKRIFGVNPLTSGKKPLYIHPDSYFDNDMVFKGADLLKEIPFDMSSFALKKIELEFLTPTRIMEKGKLITRPSMDSIARAAMRRLSSLMRLYCDIELVADFKDLVASAKETELIKDELKWVELKRYSNRRKKHLFISGFTGWAKYSGKLNELFPYLYLAQFSHLGKGTVYGLGAYSLKIPFYHPSK